MDCHVLLVLLGVVSVLWPQPGYIHPDEFFQSTEVVAGDIFNISHLRTWEFHPDRPLRDIFTPYLLFAPGFYLLRWLLTSCSLTRYAMESYAVLVIPRIVLFLASLVNLYLVRKLCRLFAVNEGTAVWLWLTSYTTWTFLMRPFSNTSETLLFSVASLLILEISKRCRNTEGKQVSSEGTERKSVTTGQHAKNVKLFSFLLGVVLCTGFFNRPTFCLFVFAPLLWWTDQLFSVCMKRMVISVVFLTGCGFLLMFVVMSLTNSFYYNPDFGHHLNDLHTALLQSDVDAILQYGGAVVAGLRVPPWSFIQYNLAAANLAEHGLHPWYTHLLVHMSVLLGPLVLLLYGEVLVLFAHWRQTHPTDVLYAIVLIPVISLSFFPHQEARFLLPILPFATVCAAKSNLAAWKSVKAVALGFNILGLIMFGWLHQGGVIPALSWLQGQLKKEAAQPSSHIAHNHIISYSTYMLPHHILFTNLSTMQVQVHDMIGAHNHPPTLQLRVEQLHASCLNDSVDCRLWILLPVPALVDVMSMEGWKVEEQGVFCPHVSMERLPGGATVWTWETVHSFLSQLCLKIVSVVL